MHGRDPKQEGLENLETHFRFKFVFGVSFLRNGRAEVGGEGEVDAECLRVDLDQLLDDLLQSYKCVLKSNI